MMLLEGAVSRISIASLKYGGISRGRTNAGYNFDPNFSR